MDEKEIKREAILPYNEGNGRRKGRRSELGRSSGEKEAKLK